MIVHADAMPGGRLPAPELTEVRARGLDFRCRLFGPLDGVPVILLHGFPTTSALWTGLASSLARRGYRCTAPDQRGYSPGARPERVSDYGYAEIAADVFAIADAVDADRFHLIGHDFGAIAGWAAIASDRESRILSWTALSVPHVRAFGTAIRSEPRQRTMSHYVHDLMEPGGVDAYTEQWSADDFALLRADWGPSMPPELVSDFLSVLSPPGALRAAFTWYAGTEGIAPSSTGFSFSPTAHPTLMIWGRQDPFVSAEACALARPEMTGPYQFIETEAGHWLTVDQPGLVEEAVVAHLRDDRVRSRQ